MSSKLALVASRSPARAKLAEAIALTDKIRKAITARGEAKRSLPDDLAKRASWIADRLEKLDPDFEDASTRSPRPESGSSHAWRNDLREPARSVPSYSDRIDALIDGDAVPDAEDDLEAAEKEITSLRTEYASIRSQEEKIDRANAQVDADLSELRGRLTSAEGDVKRAAEVVMRDEGGRDALIAAHARAVTIETALRKAIEGAASPWVPPAPQPSHSFSTVTYYANRDAKPCLWGTAAERLKTDPDASIPSIADALARLPAIDDVGAGPSARDAA